MVSLLLKTTQGPKAPCPKETGQGPQPRDNLAALLQRNEEGKHKKRGHPDIPDAPKASRESEIIPPLCGFEPLRADPEPAYGLHHLWRKIQHLRQLPRGAVSGSNERAVEVPPPSQRDPLVPLQPVSVV